MKTLFVLALVFFLSGCVNEYAKKRIKEVEYKGVIVDIYNDKHNHYVFTFSIEDNGEKNNGMAELWPKSWEYASIGDSIIKPANELYIIIKKKNGSEKVFYYR